jgi:Zinc-binding
MGLSKLQQQLKKKEAERKKAGSKATPTSAASKAKSAADAQAFICAVCRTAFPVNVRAAQLAAHADAKHEKLPVEQCWPQIQELRDKEAAK